MTVHIEPSHTAHLNVDLIPCQRRPRQGTTMVLMLRRPLVGLLGAVVWCLVLQRAECHQCSGCDRLQCPSVVDCPGGTTSDTCGCCLECARAVNETCGGRYRADGKCDEGLVCVITPVPGAIITGEEVGICKVIPPSSSSVIVDHLDVDSGCNAVDCEPDDGSDDASTLIACPPDSVPAPRTASHDGTGLCCPRRATALTCRCLPCDVTSSLCGPGQVRVLRTEAQPDVPGFCCPAYECVDHATFCDDVECGYDPHDDDVIITCPEDSYRPPTLVTQDGCCLVEQGCRCKGAETCEDMTCPDGLQKRIRQLATGQPGFCCNSYDCINGSHMVCYQNGTKRVEGETWQSDDCTTCVCQDGLSFCEPVQCPALNRCGWIGRPEGTCCPICKGCVSHVGDLQESGSTWQQDSCVTCRCDDGQIYCQAEMCSVGCINPRIVPGECCPVCDDALVVTLAPHCPSLSNCTLMCADGYVRLPNGCYQCQCVESSPEPCDLDCPNGYRQDLLGLDVCDCADDPVPTKSPTLSARSSSTTSPVAAVDPLEPTCPPMIGCTKQCLYGYRTDKFGCPRCRCNRCPPFDCAKKCRDGYAFGSDGCKLCRCLDTTIFETTPQSPTSSAAPAMVNVGRHCVSADGLRTIEDGQSWWDGCRRCFCREGHEMCALISCPVLRCINPVIRQDSCCPSCPGDASLMPFGTTSLCHLGNGHYYADGDTWQLDDCTLCICHQGTPLCIVDSCPPALCHHPVIISRLCCPVCPDDDGFLPTVSLVPLRNMQKSCRSTVTGTRYMSGDTWRVDACQSCTCRDGQITCFAQTCPILSCNKSVLKKGHCCPICTAGASSEFCGYAGDIYSVGESWLVDECTHCTCTDGGQVLCTITVCDLVPPNCQLDTRTTYGACCPVCQNETEASSGLAKNSSNNVSDYQQRPTSSTLSTSTIILIFFVVLLSLLVLLLIALLYSRHLRRVVYHRPSITKSSPPSSPLAPPRYVAASQLSSIVDCGDLDLESRWVSGLPPPASTALKPPPPSATEDEDDDDGETSVEPRVSGSDDSLHKPPFVDVVAADRSSPLLDDEDDSCDRLSSLDCDTVDDDECQVLAAADTNVELGRTVEGHDQLDSTAAAEAETAPADRLLGGGGTPSRRNTDASLNRRSW